MLFDIIGYQFGQYYDTNNNIAYFKLPDATNSVIGIAGNHHIIGDSMGNETIMLTTNELPSHSRSVTGSGYAASSCNDPTSIY